MFFLSTLKLVWIPSLSRQIFEYGLPEEWWEWIIGLYCLVKLFWVYLGAFNLYKQSPRAPAFVLFSFSGTKKILPLDCRMDMMFIMNGASCNLTLTIWVVKRNFIRFSVCIGCLHFMSSCSFLPPYPPLSIRPSFLFRFLIHSVCLILLRYHHCHQPFFLHGKMFWRLAGSWFKGRSRKVYHYRLVWRVMVDSAMYPLVYMTCSLSRNAVLRMEGFLFSPAIPCEPYQASAFSARFTRTLPFGAAAQTTAFCQSLCRVCIFRARAKTQAIVDTPFLFIFSVRKRPSSWAKCRSGAWYQVNYACALLGFILV
jgi:hypothetical protein